MNDSKSLHSRIAKTVQNIPRSGIRDFFEIVSSREDVISLGIGEPDFITPWHIREAAVLALDRGTTSYTSNMGLLTLRRGIAQYVEKKTGIGYNPADEVLVTVGVSEGLDLAIRALIEPGDEVLYHEPSYVSYNPLIQFAYGKPVAIQTKKENSFRLTRAELEEHVSPRTKVLLLNYPNNPTGAALSKKDVEDIAAFAIEHDLIVLTDEIYDELTYEREHFSIISVPGMRERTIYLHGFSKAWAMTGWRLGWMVAPARYATHIAVLSECFNTGAPSIVQFAGIAALQDGEELVQSLRTQYSGGRDIVMEILGQHPRVELFEPEGAFYAFPRVRGMGSSLQFAEALLKEYDVGVVPGYTFGPGNEEHFRLCFAQSHQRLREALQRIAAFINRQD